MAKKQQPKATPHAAFVEKAKAVVGEANKALTARDYEAFIEEVITDCECRLDALHEDDGGEDDE